jgi:hypothetical protein
LKQVAPSKQSLTLNLDGLQLDRLQDIDANEVILTPNEATKSPMQILEDDYQMKEEVYLSEEIEI